MFISRRRIAALLAVAAGWPLIAQTAAPKATFAHDIAPIVYQHCAPCHRPGEAGPFSLLTYEDVRKHARQIVTVTQSRYMPPWLPQHGYGDFADERCLSEQQIHTIAEWVAEGTPQGPVSETPLVPSFTEGWQLGPPDLIIEAPQSISLPASGRDVFWNFIFKPNLQTRRYVRAIEIRPGDKRIVHHANLIVDRIGSARKLETSPGSGFPGMDLAIERSVFDPDTHFLFWKPGSVPYSEPDGFAWQLDPGNDLVLNTHLQLTGKPERIQPSIGLYFTDTPPKKFPILIELEHDGLLNIPAGVSDFPISDNFRLPLDVDVLAIYPHAHYLGKLLEGYATLPDGSRKWLIRIQDWDLNWQSVYRYREPLFLPKGTVISMRYHYDNSAANPRNPNHPPRRVEAGNQATDEMGHLWLQVLPRGLGDQRRILEQAMMQHRVEKYPQDDRAYLGLGMIMLSRLESQQAIPVLQTAVRLNPLYGQSHNMLGAAYMRVGRLTEALNQFELALKVQPDNVNARYNLVNALIKSGKWEEATTHLQQVVAAYPNDASARNLMGELLTEQGRYGEAVKEFDRAIALDPSFEAAHKNREIALQHEHAAAH